MMLPTPSEIFARDWKIKLCCQRILSQERGMIHYKPVSYGLLHPSENETYMLSYYKKFSKWSSRLQ